MLTTFVKFLSILHKPQYFILKFFVIDYVKVVVLTNKLNFHKLNYYVILSFISC